MKEREEKQKESVFGGREKIHSNLKEIAPRASTFCLCLRKFHPTQTRKEFLRKPATTPFSVVSRWTWSSSRREPHTGTRRLRETTGRRRGGPTSSATYGKTVEITSKP